MATITDKLELLQQTKADIKQAIINKGVEVSDADNFPSYADKINAISSGGSDDIINLTDNLTITGDITNFDFSKVRINRLNSTNLMNKIVITSDEYILNLTDLDVSSLPEIENLINDVQIVGSASEFYIDVTGWNISNSPVLYNIITATRCTKGIGFETLDIRNCIDVYNPINGWSDCLTLKNLGYNSSLKRGHFLYSIYWGVESHYNVAGARQSLIDTLITYSFDRATAGYSVCPITLSSNTKSVLTEEEIAQITAKGFTIA